MFRHHRASARSVGVAPMTTRRSDVAGAIALASRPTVALICGGGGGGAAAQTAEIGRINCSLRARIPFLCLVDCICDRSALAPIQLTLMFFFTHRTISLPVIPYYRPEPVLKRWVVNPAIRKLAFAHEDDDGCPVVEDMP